MKLILWAEDDDNDFFLLERALARAGLSEMIIRVNNGEKAIAYCDGKEPFTDRARYPVPSLVILDIKMPRIDGFAVLEWIRSKRRFDNVPVVMLSNSDQTQDREQAERLKASAYLVKPWTFGELAEQIKALYRRCSDANRPANPESAHKAFGSFGLSAYPEIGESYPMSRRRTGSRRRYIAT